MIPTERLEEIREGCAKATPGPWTYGAQWLCRKVGETDSPGDDYIYLAQVPLNDYDSSRWNADASHIARLDPQTVSSIITELLALRARSSLLNVAGWQPIETAPKDGTWIDVWRPPNPGPGWWRSRITVRWFEIDGEGFWAWPDDEYEAMTEEGQQQAFDAINVGDCYEDGKNFTHWQPLPAPPAIQAKQQ